MGSIDADVEIDMDISDDEQERAVVGQVVDGRVGKLIPSTIPSFTDSILLFLMFLFLRFCNVMS